MSQRLTDVEIDRLLREAKVLPVDYREMLQMKSHNRHERASLDVRSGDGNVFRIILRRAELNPLDFSVILGYEWMERGRFMILRRYNGLSHEHENVLEREPPFYAYHIHTATERYQRSGFKEEHHAVPTDRYVDLTGAFQCLLDDCGFSIQAGTQLDLLDRDIL